MIVDAFAGPGGWDEGLRMLGRSDIVGLEIDAAACATANAAGHARIQADVTQYPTGAFSNVEGVIASPPCPDFSSAGSKTGQHGTSGRLVREGLRWTLALRPEWAAWEQVPLVIDIWRECATALRHEGYSVWVGVLDAADFGVPQNRRRAILLASRSGSITPPCPTHSKNPLGLFDELLPWSTMRESLGWDGLLDRRQTGAPVLSMDRPAPTLTGAAIGAGVWVRHDGAGIRQQITQREGAIIQGFPTDYPWRGSRKEQGQQVGDAVPPPLAAHLLAALGVGEVADLAVAS